MKKILVIDDSALMRRVMSDIINRTKEYVVEYTATNGDDGLKLIRANSDIVAVFCDINMPGMGGLELLKKVKEEDIKVPFIMFSSSDDANDTITALNYGAMEFIKKPERVLSRSNTEYERKVNNALKMADELNSRNVSIKAKTSPKSNKNSKQIISGKKSTSKSNKLVALVCSTGGPKALQQVIPMLPADLNAPVLVVQHMPKGFTETMAARLNAISKIQVKEAEEGEYINPGVVYIAKGGTHLALAQDSRGGRIYFDDTPPIVGLKPCGNIMYNSLIGSSYDEIICVVLTGMGADGTKGIVELSKHNKIYVIAQDEESSTVYGMPRAIYESGITDCVCDINDVAKEIIRKVGV